MVTVDPGLFPIKDMWLTVTYHIGTTPLTFVVKADKQVELFYPTSVTSITVWVSDDIMFSVGGGDYKGHPFGTAKESRGGGAAPLSFGATPGDIGGAQAFGGISPTVGTFMSFDMPPVSDVLQDDDTSLCSSDSEYGAVFGCDTESCDEDMERCGADSKLKPIGTNIINECSSNNDNERHNRQIPNQIRIYKTTMPSTLQNSPIWEEKG